MKSTTKKNLGTAISTFGLLGLLANASADMYCRMNADKAASERITQVSQARYKLHECLQNADNMCSREISTYNALVTGTNNAELIYKGEKQRDNSAFAGFFTGIGLAFFFGGRSLRAHGEKEELEEKLKETEKEKA